MKEVIRPWGDFKQFALNKKCTVKLLTVKPHQELSLQSHKKRTENWYFLDDGIAQLGDKEIKVKKGELIKVRKRQKHRIKSQKNTVRVIEIAFGKFDEKDETRFEDKYGRK